MFLQSNQIVVHIQVWFWMLQFCLKYHLWYLKRWYPTFVAVSCLKKKTVECRKKKRKRECLVCILRYLYIAVWCNLHSYIQKDVWYIQRKSKKKRIKKKKGNNQGEWGLHDFIYKDCTCCLLLHSGMVIQKDIDKLVLEVKRGFHVYQKKESLTEIVCCCNVFNMNKYKTFDI